MHHVRPDRGAALDLSALAGDEFRFRLGRLVLEDLFGLVLGRTLGRFVPWTVLFPLRAQLLLLVSSSHEGASTGSSPKARVEAFPDQISRCRKALEVQAH